MYVLGLTTMGDSAAVLLKDGEIVAAVEEERFSRVKHHVGFPLESVRHCLDTAGITMADVAHVGLYWKPWIIGTRVRMALGSLLKGRDLFKARVKSGLPRVDKYMGMFSLPSYIRETFGPSDFKFHFLDHHLCHAASAFFPSGFESAAILTLDGAGERASTMLAQHSGTGRFKVLKRVLLPHSLGQFYSAVTNYLGFDMFQGDEWKVMGLAAYGKPVYAGFMAGHVLKMKGDDDFQLDIAVLDHHKAKAHQYSARFLEACGPNRAPGEEITQRHMDVAASAQRVVEDVVLKLVEVLHRRTGEKNLCLAGGVAFNSVMNGRLMRESPFENYFVQPNAGDSGCAMGAALYIQHVMLGKPRNAPMAHAYHGPQFTNDECRQALDARGVAFETLSDEALTPRVAGLLAEGKIVAWFQGRMEWGPRALGNRSFLADPRRADMREQLNHKVKLREWFRPLAPSMTEDAVKWVFGKDYQDPFMVTVFPVLEERKADIPAVVHVDGTARPQSVSKATNPRYWQLIKDFEALTGIPVLMNTSFNIQEPIVCTPAQAVDTYLRSDVDCLVLNNQLVLRAA
jgi:carbamoyltransferase